MQDKADAKRAKESETVALFRKSKRVGGSEKDRRT